MSTYLTYVKHTYTRNGGETIVYQCTNFEIDFQIKNQDTNYQKWNFWLFFQLKDYQ